ncbi:helix-turn-helix domain-containing protein [Virgibacillus sp. W0430]|uniref:helix-turn-helix domain-containing protein n=1 Tax=Virgibacillus sp. W0430 TaxID=3391580 RepID=UPI003F45854E
MLFKSVILTCISRLQGERSSNAVYYILKGKRSIQTIQDIHLYQLQSFYGIYKPLSKQIYEQSLKEMYEQGLLHRKFEDTIIYLLSNEGLNWLKDNCEETKLTYFNGTIYEQISLPFIERLLLLIQVVMNYRMNNNSYIPIVDNQAVEQWSKIYFKDVKGNINAFINSLYSELLHALSRLSNDEATIFVQRLTGYKHYGKSLEQIALKNATSVQHTYLLLERTIHRILRTISENDTNYPILISILNDLKPKEKLTRSARETYKYLKNHYKPNEIARLRNLTINTIYDHIVEIAVHRKHFSITPYVNEQQQKEIISAVNKCNSFKLKTVKQYVQKDISYFQIRLVLAVITHLKTSGDMSTEQQ